MSNFNKERYDEWVATRQAAYRQADPLNRVIQRANQIDKETMSDYKETNYALWGTVWTFLGFTVLCGLTAIGMFGCPTYNVYSSSMAGKAMLAHANFSKEVAVAEAKARQESATYDKQAAITRAEAVAEANKIIGDSLKNNEEYLRYLWITDVAGANIDKTVVYIPTEANLPLPEAGRSLTTKRNP